MPNSLNVLILTSHADEAQGLVTALRNGGIPAQGVRAQNPEQVPDLIATHSCDLVLCCAYDPKIDLQAILAQHQAMSEDLPLLLITDDQTPPETGLQAMRDGARALIQRNQAGHLQLVVAREWDDLQTRRTLADLRIQLQRCEAQSRAKEEQSGEPRASIHQGVHMHSNAPYRALFGFEGEEDLDGFPILDLVAPERQAEAKAFLRACETGTQAGAKTIDLSFVDMDGNRFDAAMTAAPSELDGEPCLYLRLQTGASAHGQSEASYLDADTELPARAALMSELSRHLEAGDEGSPALILVHITGLERIATGLERIAQGTGLSAAFALASAVGQALQPVVPQGCFLARVGDDTYGVAMRSTNLEQVRTIAETLRKTAADEASQGNAAVGCLTRLALADPTDRSGNDLLDRAFRDSGTKYVRHPEPVTTPGPPERPPTRDAVLEPGIEPASKQPPPQTEPPAPIVARPAVPPSPKAAPRGPKKSSEPDAELKPMGPLVAEALSEDGRAELRLAYQPIISLMGDNQENYSILVRLLDADQQLHEAKAFIGAASATGRMGDIDRWVISRAIAEVGKHRANGHKFNFFVNIGEETLQDPELIIWICDLLRDLDVRSSWLTFQFREEEAVRNLTAVSRLVGELKQIKCRIALSGCGQLDDPQMLMQKLPLDFVLLAQDFARDLAEDKAKQERLTLFANQAQEVKVKSIVTGVEDAQALTVLWTAGVDYVQGNFLQKPSPSIEKQG